MTALWCDCGYEFPQAVTGSERRRKVQTIVHDQGELDSVLPDLEKDAKPIAKRNRPKVAKPERESSASAATARADTEAIEKVAKLVVGALIVKLLVYAAIGVVLLIGIAYAPVHTIAAAVVVGVLVFIGRKPK
jgi:hypothetical protein